MIRQSIWSLSLLLSSAVYAQAPEGGTAPCSGFSVHILYTPTGCDDLRVYVNNGTPPFSGTLSNSLGQIPFSAISDNPMRLRVCANTFDLELTDAQGCTARAEDIIVYNNFDACTSLQTQITVAADSQQNCTGAAALNISGGTAPYQIYVGSGVPSAAGQQTLNNAGVLNFTGLCASRNAYSYRVRDAAGCENVVGFLVDSAFSCANIDPEADIQVSSYWCLGQDVPLNVSVSGLSDGPFTYRWELDTTVNDSALIFTPVTARNYIARVTVTDANRCAVSAQTPFNVYAPADTPVIYRLNDTLFLDASVIVRADEEIRWFYNGLPANAPTGPSIAIQGAGNYSARITSPAVGCTSPESNIIVVAPPLGLNATDLKATWQVFPNPVQDRLQIQGDRLLHSAEIWNAQGQCLLQVRLQDPSLSLASLPTGLYWLRLLGTQGEVQITKLLKN